MYGNLWLKRVLIPLWIVQLIVVLILVVALSLSLAVLHHTDDFAGDGQVDYPEYDDIDDSVWQAVRYVHERQDLPKNEQTLTGDPV